jgi:hypothetical protein
MYPLSWPVPAMECSRTNHPQNHSPEECVVEVSRRLDSGDLFEIGQCVLQASDKIGVKTWTRDARARIDRAWLARGAEISLDDASES